MADIEFSWSAAKAAANKRKHHVSFSEALTVFYDEEALLLTDPDHSEDEDRFVLLGLSAKLRVLLVVHSYRDADAAIRIISARKANARERTMYEKTEKPMRKEYDFSKARKNPYARRLKKSVTIRLDESTVEYFRQLAEEAELPYQTLINLYLRDCAASNRRPSVIWKELRKGAA